MYIYCLFAFRTLPEAKRARCMCISLASFIAHPPCLMQYDALLIRFHVKVIWLPEKYDTPYLAFVFCETRQLHSNALP